MLILELCFSAILFCAHRCQNHLVFCVDLINEIMKSDGEVCNDFGYYCDQLIWVSPGSYILSMITARSVCKQN